MKKFWRIGEPCVWATGACLSLTLLIAATLVVVVMINGLGVFWPSPLVQIRLKDGSSLLGEVIKTEKIPHTDGERLQFKIANRDLYGLDFRWVDESDIKSQQIPDDAVAIERQEYGNFFGFLKQLEIDDLLPAVENKEDLATLKSALERIAIRKQELTHLSDQLSTLSYQLETVRHGLIRAEYDGKPPTSSDVQQLQREQAILQDDFSHLLDKQVGLERQLHVYKAMFVDANDREKEIDLVDIVRIYQPNRMTVLDKVGFYLQKIYELIFSEPRESNTEGGLAPAIFGTVLLIFIMSLFSFPFGVIAAVYLREYAKEGLIVRIVRIAVNNLAGIPSIVYGIFGLGFFIYGIGGAIDRIFYPELLPTPTFGTGGILWASLTLALLTVPVVIVSTEEALGAIPREIREGSLALGSTKFQTLVRILLPMASPGIMTGLILSMARAAGEVAPLMITGVVKLAPSLPIDGTFPYLHLDRKFMHLGFHIFDIGFQSPNVEAAKPMVFVTALLLVLIVMLMSSIAIHLRNKMKKKYTFSTF
ncbi:MAG: phosphate ABC transporter permease PstA [Desulfuromonadales bacterium]